MRSKYPASVKTAYTQVQRVSGSTESKHRF